MASFGARIVPNDASAHLQTIEARFRSNNNVYLLDNLPRVGHMRWEAQTHVHDPHDLPVKLFLGRVADLGVYAYCNGKLYFEMPDEVLDQLDIKKVVPFKIEYPFSFLHHPKRYESWNMQKHSMPIIQYCFLVWAEANGYRDFVAGGLRYENLLGNLVWLDRHLTSPHWIDLVGRPPLERRSLIAQPVLRPITRRRGLSSHRAPSQPQPANTLLDRSRNAGLSPPALGPATKTHSSDLSQGLEQENLPPNTGPEAATYKMPSHISMLGPRSHDQDSVPPNSQGPPPLGQSLLAPFDTRRNRPCSVSLQRAAVIGELSSMQDFSFVDDQAAAGATSGMMKEEDPPPDDDEFPHIDKIWPSVEFSKHKARSTVPEDAVAGEMAFDEGYCTKERSVAPEDFEHLARGVDLDRPRILEQVEGEDDTQEDDTQEDHMAANNAHGDALDDTDMLNEDQNVEGGETEDKAEDDDKEEDGEDKQDPPRPHKRNRSLISTSSDGILFFQRKSGKKARVLMKEQIRSYGIHDGEDQSGIYLDEEEDEEESTPFRGRFRVDNSGTSGLIRMRGRPAMHRTWVPAASVDSIEIPSSSPTPSCGETSSQVGGLGAVVRGMTREVTWTTQSSWGRDTTNNDDDAYLKAAHLLQAQGFPSTRTLHSIMQASPPGNDNPEAKYPDISLSPDIMHEIYELEQSDRGSAVIRGEQLKERDTKLQEQGLLEATIHNCSVQMIEKNAALGQLNADISRLLVECETARRKKMEVEAYLAANPME